MAYFLISSMVLGLLNQLQIFWQLYLIEVLGHLRDLELLEPFGRVWQTVLLHKLKSYGILGQIFGFILSFLSDDHYYYYFSYYSTLMNFLMMLSAILLSMLMILFSALGLIRHLTGGNNWNWLLNLNLTCETV